MPGPDSGGMTFPRLLQEHAARRADRPATREKDLGIWQTWTWAQVIVAKPTFAPTQTSVP